MANMIQTIILSSVMKTCCRKNAQGFSVYKEGWDDAAVLAAANEKNTSGKPFTMAQVYNMRATLYGKLAPKGVSKSPMAADSAAIRKLVVQLAAQLVALEKKVALLDLESMASAEHGKALSKLEEAVARLENWRDRRGIYAPGHKKHLQSAPPSA